MCTIGATMRVLPLILFCVAGLSAAEPTTTTTGSGLPDSLPTRSDHRFGIGLQVGDPFELNAKYFIAPLDAVTVGIGDGGGSDWELHADFLRHFPEVIAVSEGKLPLSIGIGGRFRDRNRKHAEDFTIGPRATVGIAYWFAKAPLELYAELNPVLDLIDRHGADIDLSLDGGIGIRFYL